MDYNEINKILDKYFEGNTTIKEEKKLKEYFNTEKDIPTEFLYAKQIFKHLKNETALVFEKEIAIPKKKKIKPFYYFSAIAASIIFAFFVVSDYNTTENKIVYAYYNGKAITDKHLAEKYTKEALLKISNNFNTGTQKLHKLSEFNKSQSLIKNEKK